MFNRTNFLIFLFSIFLCTSHATAQPVTVSIPTDLTAPLGASAIKVPVNITDVTDLGVVSADLTIGYSTKVLSATGVTTTDTISQVGIATSNIDDENGKISIALSSATPFSGGGTLIFILFNVDSSNLVDSSSLSLTQANLNAGAVASETSDGKLTIVDVEPLVTILIPTSLTALPETRSVQVPVYLSDVTGLGIISVEMTVGYDTLVLSAKGATLAGTIAEGGTVVTNIDDVSGLIRIGLITTTALSRSGVLVGLNFDVKSTTPHDASLLSIVQAHLNSQMISTTTSDGKITVNFGKDIPQLSKTFSMNLDLGLNMIAPPLMPEKPYTARTFARLLNATTVITFDRTRKKYIGYTPDTSGDGFPIEGGKGYIVNVLNGGTVVFTGTAWTNSLDVKPAAPRVNIPPSAWAFVVSGEVQNASPGSNYTVVVKNESTDAVATDLTSSSRGHFAAVWANLNRDSVVEAGDKLEITMLDEQGNIVSGPFPRHVEVTDIRKAYLSIPLIVGDVHPTKTRLLQNFPNPFNPETWIPYQLSSSASVTIAIYDSTGRVVRTLYLGLKPADFYTTRSVAAYWDGHNNAGERVASGVYFYTLQTKDFTATRKMLISK